MTFTRLTARNHFGAFATCVRSGCAHPRVTRGAPRTSPARHHWRHHTRARIGTVAAQSHAGGLLEHSNYDPGPHAQGAHRVRELCVRRAVLLQLEHNACASCARRVRCVKCYLESSLNRADV